MIRALVVAYARSEKIFAKRVTRWGPNGFELGATYAQAIAEAMHNAWPKKDMERALQAVGLRSANPNGERQHLRDVANAWALTMSSAATFADLAFFLILADLYKVHIEATCVNKQSGKVLPKLIFPADKAAPTARVEMVVISHSHIIAAIMVGAPDEGTNSLQLKRTASNGGEALWGICAPMGGSY